MTKPFPLLLLIVLCLAPVPLRAQEDTLTVVTYDSFAISEEVQDAFEEQSGVILEILRLADVGVMVNQAILSKDNPLGDVLYGIDNTFLSRALNEDLFVPYGAEGLADIPEEFQLDPEFRVTPVTYGDVCLNYDVNYFEENDLPLPESLEALTMPDYEGLLVVQNPATSSPGLAFLLTTIAVFGEEGDYTYLDYWRDLIANDVLIVEGWTEAYYTHFSAPGRDSGDRPLVVSYASSPPVEIYFADPAPETAPTGAIVADNTCFRQIESAGILQGTDNLEAAQQFMDFLLSVTFQEDLPLQMYVFPVNPAAELPDLFVEYAAVPEVAVTLPYEDIEANRERWIQEWTETILR
ncbi:MAG: thiamine ABC transporter substrate-binding protein [bacterium]|nr:thiamine ABC transporter substrate-binding protein [bacterium]